MLNPRSLLVLLLAASLATAAFAGDGVIEINRTRVVAGGITPEDAPGFPATLSRTGRYRLTGSLATGSRLVTAIEITAPNVDLDLNGFTITCVLPAGFITPLCPAGTTGKGVAAATATGVRVANGTVTSMGSHGVELGSGGRVEGVHVRSNGGDGILSTGAVTVLDSRATSNTGDGIDLGPHSIVSRTAAISNGTSGIRVGYGATVSHVVASENQNGIEARGGSTISESSVSANTGVGVWSYIVSLSDEGAVLVRGCSVSSNSTGLYLAYSGSLAIGNTITDNTSFGLVLTLFGGYRENVLFGNNGGQEVQVDTYQAGAPSPPDLGNNYCGTNTTCP